MAPHPHYWLVELRVVGSMSSRPLQAARTPSMHCVSWTCEWRSRMAGRRVLRVRHRVPRAQYNQAGAEVPGRERESSGRVCVSLPTSKAGWDRHVLLATRGSRSHHRPLQRHRTAVAPANRDRLGDNRTTHRRVGDTPLVGHRLRAQEDHSDRREHASKQACSVATPHEDRTQPLPPNPREADERPHSNGAEQ